MGDGLDPIAKLGFDLTELEITIGKGDENIIVLEDDPAISEEHCVIRRVLGGFVVKDLGSSNGITHDGEPVQKAELKNASVIKVGGTEIRFTLDKKQIKLLAKEPQKPQVYVTKDLLPEIKSLHAGKIDELWLDDDAGTMDEDPKKEKSKTKAALATAATTSTAGGYRPPPRSAARASQSAGNPLLGFISVFILAVLGITAGVYIKHKQLHNSDFFEDLSSGKLESIFTTTEE